MKQRRKKKRRKRTRTRERMINREIKKEKKGGREKSKKIIRCDRQRLYLKSLHGAAGDDAGHVGRDDLAGRVVDAPGARAAALLRLAQQLLEVLRLLGEVVVLNAVRHRLTLQVLGDQEEVLRVLQVLLPAIKQSINQSMGESKTDQ